MGTIINLRPFQTARQQTMVPQDERVRARQELANARHDLETLGTALTEWQQALNSVAHQCRDALERLNESKRFCDACRAAWELDDLEEMIRRRDRLLAERRS